MIIFRYRHIAIFVSIILLLFGCAAPQIKNKTDQIQEKKPCWIQHIECTKEKYPISAIGIGNTLKEAKQDAIEELAKQKKVTVYIKMLENSQEKIVNNDTKYSENTTYKATITTNETVKYWNIADTYQDINKVYHVLIYVKVDILDEIYKVSNLLKKMENTEIMLKEELPNIKGIEQNIKDMEKNFRNINFVLLNRFSNTFYKSSIEYRLGKIKNKFQSLKEMENVINEYKSHLINTKKNKYIKLSKQLKLKKILNKIYIGMFEDDVIKLISPKKNSIILPFGENQNIESIRYKNIYIILENFRVKCIVSSKGYSYTIDKEYGRIINRSCNWYKKYKSKYLLKF